MKTRIVATVITTVILFITLSSTAVTAPFFSSPGLPIPDPPIHPLPCCLPGYCWPGGTMCSPLFKELVTQKQVTQKQENPLQLGALLPVTGTEIEKK